MEEDYLFCDCFAVCEEFLTKNKYFKLVEDRCKFFNSLQDQAFELVIPVDVFDLLEFNVNLGNLVLNEPMRAADIFRSVIFGKIEGEGWLHRCKFETQLSVRLRISKLPPFKCYQLASLSLYRSRICQHKLIQMKGIISSISIIQKYLKSTKFSCVDCKKGEYTFLRRFGTSDKMLIRNELNCKVCGMKMEEDVSCRVLADKVVFHVMENEGKKSKRMTQSIIACARDELASGVQLGRLCNLVGVPIYDFKRKIHVFEVLSVTPELRVSHIHKSPHSLQTIYPTIPLSIKTLFHDRKGSSWSFVFSLTYAFADNIVPRGTFHVLKLALLLSLASRSNRDYSGLDILIVGCDSLILHRLLLYAGQFALKFHILNSNGNPLPMLCKDRIGCNLVEGGALMLCDGGVCLIPELYHADKNLKEKIVKVLDSGIIVPASSLGLTTNQFVAHRTCQIWTYLEASYFGSTQILDSKVLKLKVLMDLFPVVIYTDTNNKMLPDELMVASVLTMAQCGGDIRDSLIPHEDLIQFINYVRDLDVSLTSESQELIRGYYIASRTSRCSLDSSFLMPRTSIKTITCLSESFAKLNMRQEVGENDAIFAIYFYEEMLTCKTGVSLLGLTPSLHLYDGNLHTSIGLLVDEKLFAFKEQLFKFLHKHCDMLEDCDIDFDV